MCLDVQCPFCTSIQVEKLGTWGESGQIAHGKCRSCGVVFPITPDTELENGFENFIGLGVNDFRSYRG